MSWKGVNPGTEDKSGWTEKQSTGLTAVLECGDIDQ